MHFQGKPLKMKIIVFVYANTDGSEKWKLNVMGKSQKPKCFTNVTKLSVNYKANHKPWDDFKFFLMRTSTKEQWLVEKQF